MGKCTWAKGLPCRFDLPGLPQDSSLPWGRAAIASDFTAAKSLFQLAMLSFQDAQKHFTLAEHASRHCEIALQINNLYRCELGSMHHLNENIITYAP